MERNKLLEELQEIFRDNFDDETIILTMKTTADDIEEWDSFEQIRLLTTMESKYKIKFRLEEVNNLKNIGDMIELVIKKVGENN